MVDSCARWWCRLLFPGMSFTGNHLIEEDDHDHCKIVPSPPAPLSQGSDHQDTHRRFAHPEPDGSGVRRPGRRPRPGLADRRRRLGEGGDPGNRHRRRRAGGGGSHGPAGARHPASPLPGLRRPILRGRARKTHTSRTRCHHLDRSGGRVWRAQPGTAHQLRGSGVGLSRHPRGALRDRPSSRWPRDGQTRPVALCRLWDRGRRARPPARRRSTSRRRRHPGSRCRRSRCRGSRG